MKKSICTIAFSLFGVVMTMLMFQNCVSKGNRLLETIPVTNRSLVATVNLDRLAELTSTSYDGTTVEMSAQCRELLRRLSRGELNDSVVSSAAAFLSYIDRKCVVVFTCEDGQTFATFNIPDPDKAEAYLRERSHEAVQTIDNISFYTVGHIRVGVLDGQGWVFAGEPRRLTALLDDTSGLNVAKLDGIEDFLDEPEVTNIALLTDPGDDPDGQLSRWQCAGINADSQKGFMTLKSMRGDGENVEYALSGKVSTDFLRYFPSDLNIVAAFGRSDKEITNSDLDILADMTGGELMPYLDLIKPYLKSVDGTIAIGLKSTLDSIGNLSLPDGIAMLHMPQRKIDEIIGGISTTVGHLGLAASGSSGRISIDMSPVVGHPLALHIASADGYLTLSTFEATADRQNGFAPLFDGKEGGAYIRFDSLSDFLPGCGFGLEANMQMSDDSMEYTLSFPGSESDFTTSLLSLVNNLLRF